MKRKKSRKISKLLMMILIPAVTFLTLGILIFQGLSFGVVRAIPKSGGATVGDKTTMKIGSGTKISGMKGESGGGLFVAVDGVLYFGDENSFLRYDENDNLDPAGRYVYFGSYPQTYQPDTSVITSKTDAYGYYYGTDGNKYAKVVASTSYYQGAFSDGTQIENGKAYYFKVEPLKWKIFTYEDGRTLLVCEKAIDQVQYNYSEEVHSLADGTVIYPNNYKYSDVRAFLNGYAQDEDFVENGTYWGEYGLRSWENKGFLQKAFSNEERKYILTTNVDNSIGTTPESTNPYVCENTNDKIFLLSCSEVSSSMFSKTATDLVKACSVYMYDDESVEMIVLRSPYGDDGGDSGRDYWRAYKSSGLLGHNVIDDGVALVPALFVNMDYFKTPNMFGNTATSGEGHEIYNDGTAYMLGGVVGGEIPATSITRYDEDGNEDANGDYVYIGSYPQTYCPDVELTSQVDENGYMIGTDGNKYLYLGGCYKVEPLKWKILEIEDGEVLLVCDKIIGASQFNDSGEEETVDGKTIYPSNYANSYIRNTVLPNIYKTAFTTKEKNSILFTNVDNSISTTSPDNEEEFCCETTRDKLFLLSYADLTNPEYGFSEDPSEHDLEREKIVTDFAEAMGAYVDDDGFGDWWLRSPYYDNGTFVYDGQIERDNVTSYWGVVPAMKISAESLGLEGATKKEKDGYSVYNTGEFYLFNGTINGNVYSNKDFVVYGGTINGDFYNDGGFFYFSSYYYGSVYEDFDGKFNNIYVAEKTIINGDVHIAYTSESQDSMLGKFSCAIVNGDIFVENGAEIYIINTVVNGNIFVEEGSVLTIGYSTVVNGNIVGETGSKIVFETGSDTEVNEVNGNITTDGYFTIKCATVSGNITGLSDSTIEVDKSVTLNGEITTEGTLELYLSFSCLGINLGTTGIINWYDYDGSTPTFNIVLSEERGSGTVVVLNGYTSLTNGVAGIICGLSESSSYVVKSTVDTDNNKTIISVEVGYAKVNIINQGYNVTGTGDAYATWNGIKMSSGSYSIPVGSTISFSISRSSTSPCYPIYGWVPSSNCSGTLNRVSYYTYSYTIEKADADETLRFYAYWDTYTAYFDAVTNGSFSLTGGTVSKSSSNSHIYDGSSETVTCTATPKDGYAFGGWYADSSLTELVSTEYKLSVDLYSLTSNKAYYAWFRQQFTFTFDATDGNLESLEGFVLWTVSSDKKKATRTFLYGGQILTPTPTNAGYDFEGWFTSADGGTELSSSEKATADATYYAHWKGYAKVKVINQGSVDALTVTNGDSTLPTGSWQKLYVGSTINFSQTSTTVSVANGISVSGNNEEFSGTSYTITESDIGNSITFTATWRTNRLSVGAIMDGSVVDDSSVAFYKYNSAGPYCFENGPWSVLFGSGESVQLEALEIEGYKFIGWYLDSDCSDSNLLGESELIDVDIYSFESDKTYYACYKTLFTIVLDATDGAFESSEESEWTISQEDNKTATKSVVVGSAIETLPTNPVLYGYSFEGWFTSADGEEEIDLTASVTADATYFAHWERNEIQITLDATDGEFGSEESEWTISEEDKKTATKSVIFGSAIGTLPTAPTRTNYRFDGWFTSEDGGEEIDTSSSVTDETITTYYAHWTGLATVKIVKYGSGVTGIGSVNLSYGGTNCGAGTYLIPVGATISVTQTAGSKYRTGGITMSDGNGTFSSGSYTILDSDTGQTITFTAKWKTYYVDATAVKDGTQDNSVCFFTVEGYSGTKNYQSYSFGNIIIGSGTTSKTYEFTAIDLDGYVFVGWYSDSSCSTLISSSKTITTDDVFTLKSNKTYYACYKTGYTVTFDANGGTFLDNSSFTISTDKKTATKKVASGSKIEIFPEVTKSEYNFKGWYTESSGGTKIDTNQTVASDVTYYAQWRDSSIVEINLDNDDGFGVTYRFYYEYNKNKYYSDESLETEITSCSVPEKKYCVFSGYYTSKTGGTQYITSAGAFTNDLYKTINKDCTLYAQYTQVITRVDKNGYEDTSGGYVKIGTYSGPLTWKILDEDNYGKNALIVLIKSVGNYTFNSISTSGNTSTLTNNYKYSNIRSWLNGYTDTTYNGASGYATTGFYVKAFNTNEKKFIKTTSVSCLANTTGNKANDYANAVGYVYDKIFLLSFQEAYQKMLSTERANYDKNWMLRSAYEGREDGIYYVDSSSGYITSMQLTGNINTEYATVPAMTVCWYLSDNIGRFEWNDIVAKFTYSQKLKDKEEKSLSIERTFAIASDNSQDILLDDKKKYSTEVVLEEKRYSNDVVQLPKVVG